MPPVTARLLSGLSVSGLSVSGLSVSGLCISGLCALCLLPAGCFRAGYEFLELDGLTGDDAPAASPPLGVSGLDAGVLLRQPIVLDGGSASVPDGGGANPSTPDVDAGTVCSWATPILLNLPQTGNAQLFGGPHLSPDGATLYFSMQLGGSSEDIYRAARSSPDGDFDAPVLVSEVNSTSADGSPFVTADDSSIYFFSQRGGPAPAARDLYVASRSTTAGPFGTPSALVQVNSAQMDQSPHLSSDGLELWLGSHRGGTGFEDVYVARRNRTTDTFGTPTAVTELNSPGIDTGAALSQDSSTVYYSSERSGGAGGLDLWLARRGARGARFSSPEPLVELNGRDDDFDPTLTADEQELVFVSDRSGSPRLWHAVRYCE